MTTEEKKDDCACGGLDAVYASIDALVERKRLEIHPRDADWTRNRIFELFSLDSYRPTGATSDDTLPDDLLTRFRAAAVAAGLFDADEGSVYADIVMGMLSGTPSAVQDRFEAVEREHGGMEAMRWFYDYCVANNYVKKGVLDKNPRFDSHGLVITINLAKPEFKNMKKAAAGNSVAGTQEAPEWPADTPHARSAMRTRASRGATSARCAPSPPRSATNRGSGSSPRTGTSTSMASA